LFLGCKCRSGQFYDAHARACRIREECSCYEPQSERYIHASNSIQIKLPRVANCDCSNGSLQCISLDNQMCSSTQIFSENATLCPRTCGNYLSYYDCGLRGSGCTCPAGQVLLGMKMSEKRCINIDQCPCQYNRQFYVKNDIIIQREQGCQNCTCQSGGLWSCKRITCMKTCTVFGHAHYQTFDGLYLNHAGQCQYILVQDKLKSFRVLSQNIPCGGNGQICSKNIIIEYNGLSIDLMRGRPILVNNLELLTYQIQPVKFGSVHIYQLGIYTIVKSDDFTIRWDGRTHVDVQIMSNRNTNGLCGNNNDNSDDDLIGSNGASHVNVDEMAKTWQTSVQCAVNSNQTSTSDPCGDSIEHEQRRVWARGQCDLIKIKSSVVNNPFDLCIDKMDASTIEKYHQACLFDACQ
jgi:hypothetical protein